MSAKRVLCPYLPSPGQSVEINASEAHHATQVLRLRNGESVLALDGKGHFAPGVLEIRGSHVSIRVSQTQTPSSELPSASSQVLPIVLEIAVLKSDAMGWVVEKCVELGVSKIIPLQTRRTVVKWNANDSSDITRLVTRWEKQADQALKQCGRLVRLEIAPPLSLTELPDLDDSQRGIRYWCDEGRVGQVGTDAAPYLPDALTRAPTLGSGGAIHLLIGPEGGWDNSECDWLGRTRAQSVHLGPLIFRAETAALFALSCVAARLRGINLTTPLSQSKAESL